MKRILAAAAVMGLSFTLATAPAHAAVGKKDLLSPAQVNKVTGASTTMSSAKGKALATYKGCKQAATIKGKSGVTATYVDFNAQVSVVNGVVQARSKAQATNYLKGLTKNLSRCRSISTPAGSLSLKRLKAPKVGDQRVAFRVSKPGVIVADNVIVRKGSKIVLVALATTAAKPAQVKSLAKMAVKRA